MLQKTKKPENVIVLPGAHRPMFALSQILSIFLLAVSASLSPNQYVLQDEIDISTTQQQETQAYYVAASVKIQVEAGNFGPMADNGVRLALKVKWDENGSQGLRGIAINYEAGKFKGDISKTADDLPPGIPLPPTHGQLADVAVQELVREWNAYKVHAQRVADAMKGAPIQR